MGENWPNNKVYQREMTIHGASKGEGGIIFENTP